MTRMRFTATDGDALARWRALAGRCRRVAQRRHRRRARRAARPPARRSAPPPPPLVVTGADRAADRGPSQRAACRGSTGWRGFFERQTGLPGWAALPSAVLGDLAAHRGDRHVLGHLAPHRQRARRRAARQPGALPDPGRPLRHAAGRGADAWRSRAARPSDAAVYLGSGWWAPAGGLMIAACGAFALTGFPLDDLWHRLFGQDVTLWGPTHLMLIGGGSLATLGAMALITEAMAAKRRATRSRRVAAGPAASGARSWSAASSWRSPPSRASSTSACPSSGSSSTRRSRCSPPASAS